MRARLLRELLVPIGPLALAVLAGGAFARYVAFARRIAPPVSPEDAMRVTTAQLAELARYVEQSDPTALERIVVAMSHDPAIMSAVGVSVATVVAGLIAKGRRAGKASARTQ